jgi:hypothetical protein
MRIVKRLGEPAHGQAEVQLRASPRRDVADARLAFIRMALDATLVRSCNRVPSAPCVFQQVVGQAETERISA